MTHRICLLSGDGIGPEVIDCAEQVLRSLPLSDLVHRCLIPPWRKSASLPPPYLVL